MRMCRSLAQSLTLNKREEDGGLGKKEGWGKEKKLKKTPKENTETLNVNLEKKPLSFCVFVH